jgi:hypothetical protein
MMPSIHFFIDSPSWLNHLSLWPELATFGQVLTIVWGVFPLGFPLRSRGRINQAITDRPKADAALV